ncbi:MAG: Lrp/AsnC family transcriptional regulator [Candidatus Diapherotrites archaeon]|nr:Lrp/AsnC family transcriptional regulator [Candidatus Diapherotrites archaeon]
MDSKDFLILEELKKDSSLSVRSIARKTRIPITTVHHRINSLKESGVIEKFTVKLNNKKMGFGLSAFILINSMSFMPSGEKVSQKKICDKISKLNEVEFASIVTGSTDVIVKVKVKEINDLNKLILDKIREIPGVDKTTTMMILEEIKKE